MPSMVARAILFLSGYAPLFLIFSIQYFDKYGLWALIPAGLGALAMLGLMIWIGWLKNTSAVPVPIRAVRRKDAEVIAYMFAYVFPFLGLDLKDNASTIGLGVFFVVLMVLNVSSNMVHINPMLNLLGYHVYEVDTDSAENHTLITRRSRLVRDTDINAVSIGDDVWMEN